LFRGIHTVYNLNIEEKRSLICLWALEIARKSGLSMKKQERVLRCAIGLSVAVSVALMVLKFVAYWMTHSTAILSDLAESIIHLFAIGFAAFSMHVSLKPADKNHLYGHDKINFFSAGFEGAMIAIASFAIIATSIEKLIFGFTLEHLDAGLYITALVVVVNGILGWWLVRRGKEFRSLILEANGYHILTDAITSCGVLVGLGAVVLTGRFWIDPIVAILAAFNILRTGVQLMKRSVSGLMDQVDLQLDKELRRVLTGQTKPKGLHFARLKHRHTGAKLLVEYHLLFPKDPHLKYAHTLATNIEAVLFQEFGPNIEITSHLEPVEDSRHPHVVQPTS